MIRPLQREKIKNLNIKIPVSDYEILLKYAKAKANGNVSAWIRYAAVELPKEVEKKKKSA